MLTGTTEIGVSRPFTCNIFHCLLAYVKIGFYLFLLPFNAYVDADGKLQFQQYLAHQVICFTLHLSSLIFGVTLLWNTAAEIQTSRNSESLYSLTLFSLISVSILIFMVDCWRRKSTHCKNLLKHAFNLMRVEDKSNTKLILTILAAVLTFFPHVTISGLPEMKKYFGRGNISLNMSSIDFLQLLYAARATFFHVQFHVTVVLTFASSTFCMYQIGQSFNQVAAVENVILASSTSKLQMKSLENLMDSYLTAKFLTSLLNKAFGRIMVILFLLVIPTLGYGISSGITSTSLTAFEHLRTFHIAAIFCSLAILAAKGSRNIETFGEKAFELMWRSGTLKKPKSQEMEQLQLILQYLASSKVGVGGAPFFIISYKLLTTLVGVLITYTVIMLQFLEKN